MKMYSIAKGTRAIVLETPNFTEDGNFDSREWLTSKDLAYFDTIIDPIRKMNGHTHAEPMYDGLAAAGYALFAGEIKPGHKTPRWVIAVPYDDVKIN